MKYLSVAEMAKCWGAAERTVRNYCAHGKIPGAFLTGKTWNIPETAQRPERVNKHREEPTALLEILKAEKAARISGGIYHKVQIELTYNSNHIEGSRLTHDQTRFIFETNTIGMDAGSVNVDDILETSNHFRCIDHHRSGKRRAEREAHQAVASDSEKRHQRCAQGLVYSRRV